MRSLGLAIALGIAAIGCGSLLGYDEVEFDENPGSGGSAGNGGAGGSSAGGGAGGSTSSGGSGAQSSGGSAGAASGGTAGSASGGSGGNTDPYETARQQCIDHINQLRATKGLPPYQRWTAAESCVDQQATDDEQTGQPHNAWITHKFTCDGYGSAQNECLGGGANGIVGCLDMMWAEKDQPGCAGCDQCTSSSGCADCDFYGDTTGDVCGHYLNLRATWFTMAACGFSSSGGWAAINFQ